MTNWSRSAIAALTVASCRATTAHDLAIPLGDRPPWRTVLSDSGFRVALDTSRVEPGPEGGTYLWLVSIHDAPRGPDSMRFDRGRIRLLVKCNPLAFKSVSQELALGAAPPVFRKDWPLSGPDSSAWNMPEAGATDDKFLRTACSIIGARR